MRLLPVHPVAIPGFVVCLLASAGALGASGQQINAPAFTAGSGSSSSPNFRLGASAIGQSIAGNRTTGTNFRLWSGAQLAGGKGLDTDADGLNDAVEAVLGTNLRNADSDGDTLTDFFEVNRDGNPNGYLVGTDTNPLNADTDGDGLPDGIDPNPLAVNGKSVKVPALPPASWFALALLLGWAALRMRVGSRPR